MLDQNKTNIERKKTINLSTELLVGEELVGSRNIQPIRGQADSVRQIFPHLEDRFYTKQQRK